AVVLESRTFDPMHFEAPGPAGAKAGAGSPTGDAHAQSHTHGAPPVANPAKGPATTPWPQGAPRRLLTLRVRERISARTTIPASLSTLPEARADPAAQERAFRLGFAKGRWRINDRVFAMDETP